MHQPGGRGCRRRHPGLPAREEIKCILTDVEYDFAEQTTTHTFSQEALTAWGDSIDLLKQRLKIGNVEKFRRIDWKYTWGHFDSKYANKPGGYFAWTGLNYTDKDLYYDAQLGTVEEARKACPCDSRKLRQHGMVPHGRTTGRAASHRHPATMASRPASA